MASLFTKVIPDDIHRLIFEYLVDENVKNTIFYALVSKSVFNIVRVVVLHQISTVKENPYLKDLYGDILLGQKNCVLATFIKYSYDDNFDFRRGLFEFLQVALFSSKSPEKLKFKSVEILRRFINDKEFITEIQKATGITVKNALFPIVYEYASNNLDKMDILALCSKYFDDPVKIIKFLVFTVPQNMEKYLIPYDEKESKRLVSIVKWSELKQKLFTYGASTYMTSLLYAAFLLLFGFNVRDFLLIYLGLNSIVYYFILDTMYNTDFLEHAAGLIDQLE